MPYCYIAAVHTLDKAHTISGKDGSHMKEAIHTLLKSDKMVQAFKYLKNDETHTIDQQIELVQISSFSPFEEKRAARFKELLTEAGLDPVMDEVHNVYAHIHGTGDGPTLYVSAHLDTVFPPETPLPVKREGTKIYAPGIGDDTRGLADPHHGESHH